MSLNVNSPLSIRDQWARQHAIRGVQQVRNELIRDHLPPGSPVPPPLQDDHLPPLPRPPKNPHRVIAKVIHVGVVGAGAAGLFVALVFEYLNEELLRRALQQASLDTGVRPSGEPPSKNIEFNTVKTLKFTYDILESGPSERLGGRLYTYNFGGARDTHDYYDVGAMRFPDNPVMKR